MAQTLAGSEGRQGDLRDLWMLLTATAGVSDELERARLAATGIPSLVRCRLSAIALRQEAEASWTLIIQQEGQPLSPSHAEPVIPELDRLFGEVISSSKLLVIRAETGPGSSTVPPSLRSLGIHCLAVLPLLTLSSQLGMLMVGKQRDEGFSDQEEFALRALAEHLAMGIENLRLQQSLQRHSHELERLVEDRTAQLRQSEERHRVLLEINNAIIANLDRESLFEAIVQALRRVLPFDRASLALHDPERDVVRVSALAGRSLAKRFIPVGAEFPRQGSHLQAVLDQKKPLIERDLEKKHRVGLEDRLLEEGIRSYVAVPLMVRRQAIGTLNVGSQAPGQYSEDDADFLEEVARQVALAIENMLSYEEIAQLKAQLERENIYLQEEIKTEHRFEEIVGQVPAIRKVLKAIETVAPTEATVLITGETGTGKELVARAVHDLSPRKKKTLVKVNCAALPAGLIESELFGHEKGAFTGASSRKIGRFEVADAGTIFLDEIGDLPLELQAKLLRVLQDGEFERVGGSQTSKVDVRVIAATNRDLEKEMREERFRSDLYYRLNVFPVRVPSLHERKDDIPLLVRRFAMKYGTKLGKRLETIPQQAMDRLQAYNWPGNIRELENVIERAAILSQGSELELGEWLPKPGAGAGQSGIATLEELEREHIGEVLELTGWKVRGEQGAAKLLDMKPTTLESRMKKLGIEKRV